MKRRRVDGKLERRFLTAMIVSKPFLASVASTIDVSLMSAEWSRRIAKWCVRYYQRYGQPPKKNIESLYHSWVEKSQPEEADVEAVSDLLASLSDQYETDSELNVPYLLDEFGSWLTIRKATKLKDDLESTLLEEDKDAALQAITDFRAVDVGGSVGLDPLNDKAAWERAFADPLEPLITFPGEACRFFGPAVTRDALIGIQGPEKRGKTFWCLEFVYRALRSRRKVALFETGDLTESQVMKRLGVRIARVPLWRSQRKVKIPRTIEVVEGDDGKDAYEIDYDVERFHSAIDRLTVWRARRRFMKRLGIPREEARILVSVHPTCSVNVRGIDGILERWEHERGFVPDVVVIDYADILAPEDLRKEPRHQVNETWAALRRLSQERHCLVVAPTQASAASYDVRTQKMGHFSNDKRKLAHVTGMLGLNQTSPERQDQVMRLNWIVLRESDYHSESCLWVAQCLPLGQALCCSAR